MSLRRSYTDGPSESQKLYGSSLPPSLRWGAARKSAPAQEQETVPQSESNAKPQAKTNGHTQVYRYKKRNKRQNAIEDGSKETGKDVGMLERSRRPYAIKSAAEDKRRLLLLEDTPVRQKHAKSHLDSQDDGEKSSEHVLEWLEKSDTAAADKTEHVATGAQTRGWRHLQYHATVDDADDDSDHGSRFSVVAGAVEGHGSSDGVHVVHRTRPPNDVEPEPTRDGPSDTGNATNTDSEKDKQHRPQREPPVYAKIHVDYLSTETLRYYDIPWEYDKVSHYHTLSRWPETAQKLYLQ
jgi:hypothetical protein